MTDIGEIPELCDEYLAMVDEMQQLYRVPNAPVVPRVRRRTEENPHMPDDIEREYDMMPGGTPPRSPSPTPASGPSSPIFIPTPGSHIIRGGYDHEAGSSAGPSTVRAPRGRQQQRRPQQRRNPTRNRRPPSCGTH